MTTTVCDLCGATSTLMDEGDQCPHCDDGEMLVAKLVIRTEAEVISDTFDKAYELGKKHATKCSICGSTSARYDGGCWACHV